VPKPPKTKSPPARGKPAAKPKEAAKPETIAEPAAPPPTPQHPTAVTPEFAKALKKHLGRLGDDALAAEAAGYVLTGEPADVLLRLGKLADAGKALILHGGYFADVDYKLRQHILEERLTVYREGKEAPPAVWARFGEVFGALARAAQLNPAAVKGWPDWLAAVLGELFQTFQGSSRAGGVVWPAGRLLPLFAEAGLPAGEALRLALDPGITGSLMGSTYYFAYTVGEHLFDGWPAVLAAHQLDVRDQLPRLGAKEAAHTIPLLGRLGYDFAPVVDVLARLAVAPAKATRDAAAPVLFNFPDAAAPLLEGFLATGKTDERNEAAALLWRLKGDAAAPVLREHLKGESSEKVRQTVERLLASPDDLAGDAAAELTPPPLAIELGKVPFPEAARERVREAFRKTREQMVRNYEQELARWNGPDRPRWMHKPVKPEPVAEAALQGLFEFVAGERETLDQNRYHLAYNVRLDGEVFAPPGVHLIHVVRLCYALGRFRIDSGSAGLYWYDTTELDAYRARCPEPFGLRELDAATATLPGVEPGAVAMSYLRHNSKYREFCDWEPGAIWPAFADRLPLLRDCLTGALKVGQHDYYQGERKRNAFKVLAAFPVLPPGFVPLLWDLALGTAKADRPLAQAALRSVPDKAPKVAAALANGKPAVRETAAEWLGNLGDPSVVPALKAAYRKETHETVKGVIMVALEKLKADVSEFLDRKKLAKEAAAGLEKAPPVAGVDPARLPKVHWQDTGKPVDPAVVRWWVVQAAQQGAPACGPILRRYLAMCRPADTAALARVVLAGWLDAPQQKGLLAIVSAAGDADCVRSAEKYIRTWFGQKMAQCKALIEVLAWVEHPLGLQVLLSIANRFRTAALRDLAARHVTAVAEREGWTLDELADRTVPDGGFVRPAGGGRATLVLDYGPRRFTATLDDDLEPVLAGEGGKVLKALPAPAKADDPEKAKEAKAAFADARKQVKDVVKRQAERLYEAMCTQRAWRFADWKRFLGDHPVVGRLCVRLVWAAYEAGEGGKLVGCFRPLDDGSLTDEADDAVTFPNDAVVRVAHAAVLPAGVTAAWKRHLADYGVEPLFPQFGRAAYVLPEDKAKETEVKDFQGYEAGAFQVRGRLTRQGYVRGEAQDAGWFYEYTKPFRSLGVRAEIAFSGNCLPEEDRTTALGALTFTRLDPEGQAGRGWNRKPLELGKVPPVLLSECYNDLQELAGEGTGFNPDWQKKSYY
jgi:HEAT repeat protein